jgi:hypothetical protein
MPMDLNVIKDAFSDFEGENFVGAKEKLVGQVKIAKNDYLKNKLGLSGDVMNLPITSVTPIVPDDDVIEDDPEPVVSPKTRKSLRKK